MRLLAVPNWSFGRNTPLLHQFQNALARPDLDVHYCQGDVDHNRTVTAFSGEPEVLSQTLLDLCELAFDAIDLNRHVGVHPRIGALDVCPIVCLTRNPEEFVAANEMVADFSSRLATQFQIPVFLYERSERGRHEADLPSLRKGGFGGLQGRILSPDYGPTQAHERLGVSIVGVRDFLLAFNVDLATESIDIARLLAKKVRQLRAEGDPRFLGVRSLGFSLASRQLVQVSFNMTLPDITQVDPVIECVMELASRYRIRVAKTELIGVIRDVDVPTATRLPISESQVVRFG